MCEAKQLKTEKSINEKFFFPHQQNNKTFHMILLLELIFMAIYFEEKSYKYV